MKRFIILLLFIFFGCEITTNQSTEMIKEENVDPAKTPMQLSYKPAIIDFTMNMTTRGQEQKYSGTIEVSQFGESLIWKSKLNLNQRDFMDIKCVTDVYGNIKECNSPIVNNFIKLEERKALDTLVKELKKNAITPLPDKSFVTGAVLYDYYKDEEKTTTTMRGKVKGQGMSNNRKIVIVDVSGSVNYYSLDNKVRYVEGYILYDMQTAHAVKFEITVDNDSSSGRDKIVYNAKISP